MCNDVSLLECRPRGRLPVCMIPPSSHAPPTPHPSLPPSFSRRDAEALKAYMASGLTEADFLRAIESPAPGNAIEEEISKIAKSTAFLPERYFSFGLCKVCAVCVMMCVPCGHGGARDGECDGKPTLPPLLGLI